MSQIKPQKLTKDFYETIQVGIAAIALASAFISIPTCTKRVEVAEVTAAAQVEMSAIENGLIQKVVIKQGSSQSHVIWVEKEENINEK